MFNHIVAITNLHLNTSDHSKNLSDFLDHVYSLLEQWRLSTPLCEQQAMIDLYNTNPTSPYVCLWLLEHENEYGWRNTFPTVAFHACMNWRNIIVKDRLPLILQRMEQAMEEHDEDLFKQWEPKSAARMFRRLLVGDNMEVYHDRSQQMLLHMRSINRPLFDTILLNLPKEYIQAHQDILQAHEFLANRQLLVFFNDHSRGLSLIDSWMHQLNFAQQNIRTLSLDVCQSICACWRGQESRNLSDKDNLKIVALLTQHYPLQFERMFPLFFDLDDAKTAPRWQVQAALEHLPEHLPNVAGVLADQFFNTVMREGSAAEQWREMTDFYSVEGVMEYVAFQKLPLDLYYIICHAPHWKSNLQKALSHFWDFPHPGLQEMADLLLEFAGGPATSAPQHTVFSNSASHPSQLQQEFEHLLHKRTLEQELQSWVPKTTKVKKM